MNVPLSCDLRSPDWVGTFASKWTKEVNRSLVINVPLACDRWVADWVATFLDSVEKTWQKSGFQYYFKTWFSMSWPIRNLSFKANKRREEMSGYECSVPRDHPSAKRVAGFRCKWAEEVNRSVVTNVLVAGNLRSADWVGTSAVRWRKHVKTSVVFMNIPLVCDARSADRVGALALKGATDAKRSILMNVFLVCDLRSTDWVATFASKCAKEGNRCLIMNVPFPCDVRSAARVGRFVCRWAKEVNRTIFMNVLFRCDLRSGDRVGSFASR